MPMWCEMVIWMQWALFSHQSVSQTQSSSDVALTSQREQDVNIAILTIKGK